MLVLQAPSSKSVSHRMLIAAALAPGKSTVRSVLDCDDTRRTLSVLESAGAKFESLSGDEFKDFNIIGMNNMPQGSEDIDKSLECYIGESGTSCRLLAAILSTGRGYFTLCGAKRMHERPMGALVSALQNIGANIKTQKEGFAPLLISANGLQGGKCEISLDESSQYLSGLLLAAPLCKDGLTIIPTGDKAVSWPYVALSLQTLEAHGIEFTVKYLDGTIMNDWKDRYEICPNTIEIEVKNGTYKAGSYTVEGDWSGASYLLAAGVLGHKAIKIEGLNVNSAQGDKALLEILKAMGAKIEIEDGAIIVKPSLLNGIEVDMNFCPDIVPTVAVLAACAEGITKIKNVPHLRVKESDRIASVATELSKLNIKVQELDDGLIIHGVGFMPSIENEILFCTHNDHRIAMSMSLFGLNGAKISFDDKEVVRKSFPKYWSVWEEISKKEEICKKNDNI